MKTNSPFTKWVLKNSDKILHGFVTFIIVLMAGSLHYELMGVLIAIVATLAKEMYDRHKGGQFDWWDVLAGGVGIGLALLMITVGDKWYFHMRGWS